jgi:hypothetical protein
MTYGEQKIQGIAARLLSRVTEALKGSATAHPG